MVENAAERWRVRTPTPRRAATCSSSGACSTRSSAGRTARRARTRRRWFLVGRRPASPRRRLLGGRVGKLRPASPSRTPIDPSSSSPSGLHQQPQVRQRRAGLVDHVLHQQLELLPFLFRDAPGDWKAAVSDVAAGTAGASSSMSAPAPPSGRVSASSASARPR